MNLSGVYRNTSTAFIAIGMTALMVLWIGGWGIVTFMRHAYGYHVEGLRCAIPVGHARFPFWPLASLVVLILHGVFMYRYSSLIARLGVPRRWWEGRLGSYDAQLENPFARVIAEDCVVVGITLIAFLLICTHGQHYGWYGWRFW